LGLEARRRIYQHIEDYPGLHLSEIARALQMEVNHAKHHLRSLEKHDMVSSHREDGYWRFYPRREGPLGRRDSLGADEKKVLALLRRPVPLHVTLLLLEHEEMNHQELREKAGVAHGTLHYHLKKMEQNGHLISQKDGRERRYRLQDPERALRLLVEHRPPDHLVKGFLDAWEALEI
jgi:predicted transcriptional regulator